MGVLEDRFYKLSFLITVVAIVANVSPYLVQTDMVLGLFGMILVTRYRGSWMMLYLMVLLLSCIVGGMSMGNQARILIFQQRSGFLLADRAALGYSMFALNFFLKLFAFVIGILVFRSNDGKFSLTGLLSHPSHGRVTNVHQESLLVDY